MFRTVDDRVDPGEEFSGFLFRTYFFSGFGCGFLSWRQHNDRLEARRAKAALKQTDLRAVETSKDRKIVLGDARLLSIPPEVCREHPPRRLRYTVRHSPRNKPRAHVGDSDPVRHERPMHTVNIAQTGVCVTPTTTRRDASVLHRYQQAGGPPKRKRDPDDGQLRWPNLTRRIEWLIENSVRQRASSMA